MCISIQYIVLNLSEHTVTLAVKHENRNLSYLHGVFVHRSKGEHKHPLGFLEGSDGGGHYGTVRLSRGLQFLGSDCGGDALYEYRSTQHTRWGTPGEQLPHLICGCFSAVQPELPLVADTRRFEGSVGPTGIDVVCEVIMVAVV